MNNPNPIYYKDLVTPDESIENLIDQLDDLIKKYDDTKKTIQAAAANVAKSMESVSSATEDQRKQIQLATEQSDKLVKQYRDVTTKQWEATQAFAEAAKAKKESAQIDKLVTQINTSVEGSYNRLSAQYRLNKIRLNELSAEQRATVPEYKALEEETRNMYEEMKRLQEMTGKHQLNVGNYADAAKGLRTELMSLIQQMAYMKTEGKGNTEEYRNMATRAAELKDAMMDANEEIRHTADDTKNLNGIMAGLAVGGAGLTLLTKHLGLFGEANEDAQDAEKGLGVAMAAVAGLVTVQTNLQKQSNLMVGIGTIQTSALTAAEKLRERQTKKSTVATAAATIAQKAFNAVASANPYVLLAVALVTVVGAIVAFAVGSNKAAKEQNKLNASIAAGLDYLDSYSKNLTRVNNERIEDLRRELDVAKARNASNKEIQKIENQIYDERIAAHDKMMQIYGDEIANQDVYQKKLETLQKTLLELQKAQAAGKNRLNVDVDLDGRIERVKIKKAIEAVQGQIDNYGRAVEIATTIKTEGKDIASERAAQLAERIKTAQAVAKAEIDTMRKAEDERIALMKDARKRERLQAGLDAKREMQDIETRLKTDTTLTAKQREALVAQEKAILERVRKELKAIDDKYRAIDVQAVRETEDIRIALMKDGADKQRELLRVSYERQIEDLTTALETNTDLTVTEADEMYKRLLLLGDQYAKELKDLNNQIAIDQMNKDAAAIQLRLDSVREGSQEQIDLTIELLKKQRDIEIAENRAANEDVRQDESLINAKWNAIILKQTADMQSQRALMILDMQQDLAASEFDLLNKNERQKTKFLLQAEKERLQKILELNKTAGTELTAEQVQTIKNQIAAIDRESKSTPFNNIYEVLGIGLNSEQQEAMNTVISETMSNVSELINMWVQEADAAVQAADKKVSAAQKALDAEIEARNNGYANNVVQAQKELELEKQNQQKALEEKKKAQRVQLALDTISQASSLITASANIWSSLSVIPYVGPALAAAALVTMWGSFAAAKIKAVQMSNKAEQYGDGTVELLQGGSHASGHDIDLGTKADGTRRRAEGGEYFAVINKRNSRRFGSIIPDVINAFNDGTFADKYQKTSETMSGMAVTLVGANGTDISQLEQDVRKIREQGARTRFVDNQGNTVEVYKNVTRRILK